MNRYKQKLDLIKFSFFIFIFLKSISLVVLQKREPRILNSDNASKYKYPYSVFFTVNGEFRCGGIIVNKDYVLTAGHCVTHNQTRLPISPRDIRVIAGTRTLDAGGSIHCIKKVIVHKYYVRLAVYDIALLKVANRFQYSKKIRPAKLYRRSDIPDAKRFIIIGWGKSKIDGSYSNYLRWTYVQLCKPQPFISLLCFLPKYPSSVPCTGDSGSPVITDDYDKVVVGIASLGFKDCPKGLPFGYTSVGYHYEWIVKNVRKY